MKPNWEDAPAWAKYVAQERDGGWWWFEKKPVIRECLWTYTDFSIAGHMQRATDTPVNGWKESLERRS